MLTFLAFFLMERKKRGGMELNNNLNKCTHSPDQIIAIKESRLEISRAMLDATTEKLVLITSQNI